VNHKVTYESFVLLHLAPTFGDASGDGPDDVKVVCTWLGCSGSRLGFRSGGHSDSSVEFGALEENVLFY
jgi:hypothetical protein